MKVSAKVIYRALIALVFMLAPGLFPRQAGMVKSQQPPTVTEKVFTGSDCSSTLTSGSLQNIGQIGHAFSFTATNPGPNLQVAIRGSADGSTWYKISNDAQAQPGIIVGVGAYPFLDIQITDGGAGCTITGTYVGSTQATTVNVSTSNAQFMYQDNAFVSLPANADQSDTTITPPYGNANGFVVFSYLGAAGPAGSTLTVSATDSLSGLPITIATLSPVTTVSDAQVLDVPNLSASALTVTYTSGGSSAATIDVAYYFTYPGQGPSSTSTPTSVDVVAPNPLPVSGTFTPSGTQNVDVVSPNPLPVSISGSQADPCAASGVAKLSAAINIATGGGTQQLVAPSAGKSVYVCSALMALNGEGQTITVTFEAGTGATCGTGTVNLSGPMTSNNTNTTLAAAGPTILAAPSGDGVCVVVSGTYAASFGGSISYVQQ
jgi:hypothetical protein